MLRIILTILLLQLTLDNSFSQTKIASLDISGNDFFSASEIQNLMVSKKDGNFREEQFRLDLKTIRDKYKSAGFLFAKFTQDETRFTDDSSFVDIKLRIDEGKKVLVGKIDIQGNTSLTKEKLLKGFVTKPGENLNDNALNEDISNLLKEYESAGLPFAKVSVKEISLYDDNGTDKIKIELAVTENSKVKIEQVKIIGNESTQDYVILRELKLNENKTINSQSLRQFKERLDRLNIFEYVSDPKIYSLKNSKESGLLIEVKEGNTNTFDGIIGYNPPSGDQSGYITGLVNVSFRNLFGTARKLEAKYLQEVRETQELAFGYTEPYLFGLPLNIDLGFLQRIQDTAYTKRNFDLKGDIVFSDKFTMSAIGAYERVIPSDVLNSSFRISDSQILASGVEIKYDTRDNIFIPQSGFLYRSYITYGNKSIFNIGQFQTTGVDDNFVIEKYFIELDNYFSFVPRQTNVIRLYGGIVSSDLLEDSDFFRIGGNRFLRGYRYDQFLASKFATYNIEPRYSISRKGFLFAFLDGGYYFKPYDQINNYAEQSGFLYGYGIGIRLETGLGLIGVSYALGKDNGFLEGLLTFGLINDF